jgi:hypothetical protein
MLLSTPITITFACVRLVVWRSQGSLGCQRILARMLGRDFDIESHDCLVGEDSNLVYIVGVELSLQSRPSASITPGHREKDTINLRTHPFVIGSSSEIARNAHPFRHARVLSCFCI